MVSCGDDDDDDPIVSITTAGELGGAVSGGSAMDEKIDSVVCYVYLNDNNLDYFSYETEYELATATFKNGNFNVNLETPTEACLNPFLDVFGDVWDETTFTDITVSDSLVGVTDYLYFDAYKDGSYVGDLIRTNMTIDQYYEIPKKGWAIADYFYCDGDVTYEATEKGNYDDTDLKVVVTYDLSLKKGWNVVVWQCSGVTSEQVNMRVFANAEPSGMKWLFDGDIWSEYIDYSKTTKSVKPNSSKSIWQTLSQIK